MEVAAEKKRLMSMVDHSLVNFGRRHSAAKRLIIKNETHPMRVLLLAAIIATSTAGSLTAKAPESVSDLVFTLNITSGSGAFAPSGRYMFVSNQSDNRYWILAIDDTVVDSSGTYVYTKVDENTGSVVASDSEVGVVLPIELTFLSDSTGTFSASNDFGFQAGTFEVDVRYSPDEVENLHVGGLTIRPNEGGGIELEVNVMKSDDFATWEDANGAFSTVSGSSVKWSYQPDEPKQFFRISVENQP